MRKSERGDGEGCFVLSLLLIIAFICLLPYITRCDTRGATASCLKQHLGVEHSASLAFEKDEAEALAPTVKAKLDELWNTKNKAHQMLEQASGQDRQKCLDEYQAAREAYQCFDRSVRAYGLWPPPERPTAEATPSVK